MGRESLIRPAGYQGRASPPGLESKAHEQHVPITAGHAHLTSDQALVLESEGMVEGDRPLVIRKHAQAELGEPDRACPGNRHLHEGAPEPGPALGVADKDGYFPEDRKST